MTVYMCIYIYIQTVYVDNIWLHRQTEVTFIGQCTQETDCCQDSLIFSLSHRVPKSTAAATSKANVRHIVYLQKHHRRPCQHVKLLADMSKQGSQVNMQLADWHSWWLGGWGGGWAGVAASQALLERA